MPSYNRESTNCPIPIVPIQAFLISHKRSRYLKSKNNHRLTLRSGRKILSSSNYSIYAKPKGI